METSAYFLEPKEYYNRIKPFFKDKTKSNKENGNNPFGITVYTTPIENLRLIDIKVWDKIKEDKIFEDNEIVSQNLRRGQSLIYDVKDDSYDYARVGLPKFFDYKKDFKKEDKSYKAVLGNISCEKDEKLYAYYTEKENGENFQVSYNSKYQAWIVASKNVSVLLRSKEDIQFYKNIDKPIECSEDPKNPKPLENKKHKESIPMRFAFAVEFAEYWFELLDENILAKPNGKELYEEFISLLSDHTLVGESVGGSQQHIKIYRKRMIYFFGVVNNRKFPDEYGLSPKKSEEILNKFGFSFTAYEKQLLIENEKISDYTSTLYRAGLDDKLNEIFDVIRTDKQEGWVVYVVRSDKDGNESLLNLFKMKTFQYRLLRFAREKCKVIARHKRMFLQNKRNFEGKNDKKPKTEEEVLKECLKNLDDRVRSFLTQFPKSAYNTTKKDECKKLKYLSQFLMKYYSRDGAEYVKCFASYIEYLESKIAEGKNVQDIDIDETRQKFNELLQMKDEDDDEEEEIKKEEIKKEEIKNDVVFV